MEKLIELLNEYVGKHNKSDLYYKFELENGELYCYNDVSDVLWTMQDEAMVICSKKFGFIRWLVENDKIDFSNIKRIIKNYEVEDNEVLEYYDLDFATKKETLLMLLSISEKPIEDLISYLK